MIIFILPRSLRAVFQKRKALSNLFNYSVLFLLISVLYILTFKFSENVSWIEAIWQAWQTTTTVGYGNQPAETLVGRLFSILFGTSGIAVLGVLITAIFDAREEKKYRKRMGMINNPYKNGYVIFNFPGIPKFQTLVREIRHVEKDVPICVVDGRIDELPLSVAMIDNVHFVKGSILDKETYQSVRLKENKVVIIFPVESSKPDSDGTTLTVTKMVSRVAGHDTRIIYVLVDSSNSWLFEDVPGIQIIEYFEILGIVQECQDPYSSQIVQKLLLNTEGANPKTFTPKLCIGRTWGELQIYSVKFSSDKNLPINLFAIIHDGVTNSCPEPSTVIHEGDFISVITYTGFEWDLFEKEMQLVQEESKNK